MGYDHCSEGYMQSRPPAIRPALLRFGSSLVWTPSLALALFYFLKIFFTFGSVWAAGQRVCIFFWDQPLTQRPVAHPTAILIHVYLHQPTLNKNCQPLVPILSPLKRHKKHSSRGFSYVLRVLLMTWGDNPCSLAGLGLQEPGDVAISLGTSDTMCLGKRLDGYFSGSFVREFRGESEKQGKRYGYMIKIIWELWNVVFEFVDIFFTQLWGISYIIGYRHFYALIAFLVQRMVFLEFRVSSQS